MATIIYVHGRGLKPSPDCERGNWLRALNRGLGRLGGQALTIPDDQRFQLAYWSNLFYPDAPVPDCVVDAQAAPPVVAPDTASLTGNELQALQAYVDHFWTWRLPQPAPTPDASTKSFEDSFVRDVIKFFGLGYGTSCMQPLKDSLAKADDDVMLVSHSFGTVLAYEVLASYLEEVDSRRQSPIFIDTWVTMGSPLGWAIDLQARIPAWQETLVAEIAQGVRADLGAVRDDIAGFARFVTGAPAPAPPAVPAAAPISSPVAEAVRLPAKEFPRRVGRWFNIYDRRDPVACEGGIGGAASLALGETFLYNDPVQGPVQRAFDNVIRNDACPPDVWGVSIDAHDDFNGYGQCAQLAQLVADFWKRNVA